MNRTPFRRGRLAVAAASAVVTLAALLVPTAAIAVDEPALPAADGLTELTAAASCWEIKQNNPASPDGVYWLLTPAMTKGAEQFYCDQTRNGGGWVLIGRGREDWSVSNAGSGTAAQVRGTVTGTDAFVPRQLSSETIDQLNNGEPISAMTDGIRLVRATNQAGTTWQDLTFTLKSPRDSWTWQFNNQQRVNTYTIDGTKRTVSGNGTYTANFGADNNYARVSMATTATQGWKMGFGFGSNLRGNPSATSYLWSKDTSTGYARPFTQVFIRPKLTSTALFTAIPETGTAAQTYASVADSFAQTQNWGVAGLGAGPSSVEASNEVSAFTEVGSTVFVGGNFTSVQKNASGGSAVSQKYLAAFSRDTAEFVTTFRPTFNNQVMALAALPNNRVAAGGYFTEVNGQPYAGLVVLNATTGAVDTAFTGRLINYLSGGVPIVRSMDVQDGWLYVAGVFTHSAGGTSLTEQYTRGAARLSVVDGTPDSTWNPELNGTVMDVDASANGDRVYLAGFFNQSRSQTADKAAAVSATGNELYDWQVHFSNRDGGRLGYQQAVLEVGDRVWLAGSEHSLVSYDRDDFAMLTSTIGLAGGDFQSLATDGENVYGGCHCFETQYEGATAWPTVGTNWTSADAIYGSGAWSADTGARVNDFNGAFYTRGGKGVWALFVDSTGQLWQGGDYTNSMRSNYSRQWSGGFVRHTQVDATAPTAPSGLTATVAAGGVDLAWSAATDDVGVKAYQVLRNDRVVATVTGTSLTLPAAPSSTHYFVRAVDARGNVSASTAAVTAVIPPEEPEEPETATLIAAGSTWSYLFTNAGPAGTWTSKDYDASSWQTGAAPLGWGQASLGTTLTSSETSKPIVSFYRRSFDVADASKVESVTVTTRADDGVVVYLNGVEIGRSNVTGSAVGSYATSAISAANALANPVTFTVPGNLVTTGTNVISASVHSNYRSTPSHSFELTAEATIGTQPVVEPEPEPEPEPTTETVLATGSTWSYAFPTAALASDWASEAYDDTTWATGAGTFGWGYSTIATALDTSLSPRPLTSYYRTTVSLDAVDFDALTLTTRADDGIVVYVNGTEVGRKNMPAGATTLNTYASSAIGSTAVLANPYVLDVPLALLHTGDNTIAVEVHSNYRTTPSHSFEMEAVAS
ncbi:fibrinogen-like YCDxxxxGGGW domain-containing protein [Microbacterium sp. NPDC055903]